MNDHVTNSKMSRLRSLPVQVAVHVCGQSMPLDHFLEWTPGTILTFDQLASSPLAVRIGDQIIGTGRAVKIGQKLGLQIGKVG